MSDPQRITYSVQDLMTVEVPGLFMRSKVLMEKVPFDVWPVYLVLASYVWKRPVRDHDNQIREMIKANTLLSWCSVEKAANLLGVAQERVQAAVDWMIGRGWAKPRKMPGGGSLLQLGTVDSSVRFWAEENMDYCIHIEASRCEAQAESRGIPAELLAFDGWPENPED